MCLSAVQCTMLHVLSTAVFLAAAAAAASGDFCQTEMSRAVRFALWDYQSDQPLTKECDADVDAFCPKVCTGFASLSAFGSFVLITRVMNRVLHAMRCFHCSDRTPLTCAGLLGACLPSRLARAACFTFMSSVAGYLSSAVLVAVVRRCSWHWCAEPSLHQTPWPLHEHKSLGILCSAVPLLLVAHVDACLPQLSSMSTATRI